MSQSRSDEGSLSKEPRKMKHRKKSFERLLRRIKTSRHKHSKNPSTNDRTVTPTTHSAQSAKSRNTERGLQNQAKSTGKLKDSKREKDEALRARNGKLWTMTETEEGALFGYDEVTDIVTDMTTAEGNILRGPQDPRLSWALMILEQGPLYVMKKFRNVSRFKPPRFTADASKANIAKNRYADIQCNDKTRVILRDHPCDYIHANWITTPKGVRFICTQGPMKNTLSDFWRMIVQEDCRTIIMLCCLEEDSKEMCTQYYPTTTESPFIVGDVVVTLINQNESGELGIVDSLWKVKYRDRESVLRHLQFKNWPDHSAPSDTRAVLELHREINKCPADHPIVVHCSAGIGRTCTLIGVELLLEAPRQLNYYSGITVIKRMRYSRLGAVQKPIQFLFMHYVILEEFCQKGVLPKDDHRINSFREVYGKLVEKANKLRLKKKNKKAEQKSEAKAQQKSSTETVHLKDESHDLLVKQVT